MVNSLARKLNIGSIMQARQDSCGISESLPTDPMVDEGVEQCNWTLKTPLLLYHENIPNANC